MAKGTLAPSRVCSARSFARRVQHRPRVIQEEEARLGQLHRRPGGGADPPVLILDEAVSSIDTCTEAVVQRGMDALMEGRTDFVIVHRLSTVRNAKAILVLDHGRIIERGSHRQLIAERGQYYRLYTGAFELE